MIFFLKNTREEPSSIALQKNNVVVYCAQNSHRLFTERQIALCSNTQKRKQASPGIHRQARRVSSTDTRFINPSFTLTEYARCCHLMVFFHHLPWGTANRSNFDMHTVRCSNCIVGYLRLEFTLATFVASCAKFHPENLKTKVVDSFQIRHRCSHKIASEILN